MAQGNIRAGCANPSKLRIVRSGLLAAAVICGGLGGSGAAATTLTPMTLIKNVTVVDTATGKLRSGVSVLLKDGRISRIAPAGRRRRAPPTWSTEAASTWFPAFSKCTPTR